MTAAGRSLLVTGGAGFIGSCFVRQALESGNRVVVLDALTYAGHLENLTEVASHPGYRFVQGDIGDAALVRKLLPEHGIDAIIGFAAESHVDRSISGPADFIRTNVLGTATLLDAALSYWRELPEPKKSSFRFVQVSTDEVYGSLGPTGKFSETTPYAPNSPYSASKAASDHLARAWFHTYGLPTITTNCSNNYGPRQYPEKLIPHLIHCALTGRPLPVYGDGMNVRDWIHVEDHSRGVMLALEKGRPGETYCFGGDSEKPNLEVVRSICRALDERRPRSDGKKHESAIAFVTDRLGHDRRYAIDDTKAVRELGFQRKHSFETGLLATVDWYLAHDAWREAVLKSGSARS